MDFEQSFTKVQELIERFKAGEKLYLSQKYQETELRQDFLDDFFRFLGWNVGRDNENPYKREVRIEKGMNVSGAKKRTDYAFFIEPNFRDARFFAEAKKPSKSLSNDQDYFQTIRYGWNANTPIAILTDFEEFHILDCRFKPDITTAQSGSHKKYHYSHFADKAKFAEIYYLFSKEAVTDNSLEKYAETLPRPVGKAIQKGLFKGSYQSIDESFLEYIDDVRETLAKAFKKNDNSLNSEQLTEATQRTIDRLVFIRFLEDKLIEPDYYVSEFGDKGNAWNDFITISRKLDAKYNGIVFKKHFIDEHTFKGPELRDFHSICSEICHLNSPYDFNAIPIHILGSIYERFLGKIVHATEKRVQVEEKPEVQKSNGVYYTPKYIVEYIVKNTVGEKINGKTPEQISKLCFADIACGSGSFLIGVLECLLDYHTNYYQNHQEKAKKDGCHEIDGHYILSIKQKQKILLNNIYGVDIDQQATEVTQLSLALKMLEDETTATANEMQVLFREKILPDLSKNIVCGNSLIGNDILTFNGLFSGEEERKLNPMDFETSFQKVIKNGGFDAIVGNPPYINAIQLADLYGAIFKNYLKAKYKSTRGTFDIYIPFFERAITLCKPGGVVSFITPNKFLSSPYAIEFRKLITEKYTLNELVDYSSIKVFDKPSVYPVISIFSNDKKAKKYSIQIKKAKKTRGEYYSTKVSSMYMDLLPENLWGVLLSESVNLVSKIFKNRVKLEDIANVNATSTAGEADEFTKYIQETKVGEKYYKIINTGTIDRYDTTYGIDSFSNKGKKILKPVIDLSKIKENRGQLYRSPKIIFAKLALQIHAFLDFKGEYASINTNCVYLPKNGISLHYLCAILNSKLLSYVYSQLFSGLKMGGGYFQFQSPQLRLLPIHTPNLKNKSEKAKHDKIVKLVEQMIDAKRQLCAAKTDKDKTYYERKCGSLDLAIDTEVYELYDITEEEIKIIEGAK